jgi:DNA-binding MarR family transcriptional regulator
VTHPRSRLDDLLLNPVRFSILALLHHVNGADFSVVRDEVEISDSLLSKQVSILAEAGYVEVQKSIVGKRPNTRLELTLRGRETFAEHVAVLHAIVNAQHTEATDSAIGTANR